MKLKAIAMLVILMCSNLVWAKAMKEGKLQKVQGGYTLEFEVPDHVTNRVNTLGLRDDAVSAKESYSRVRISGYKYTDEVGKPELPYYAFYLAITDINKVPTFEVLQSVEKQVSLEYECFPTQEPWAKSQPASERTFSKDAEYYKTTGEKSVLASVDNVFDIRNVPCVYIKIRPFSYNPVEKRLTIVKKFTLKINTNTDVKITGLSSNVFEKYLKHVLANFEDVVAPVNKKEKDDYLIITAPTYEAELEEFVNFRKIRYNVEMVTTSTTGTSTDAIESYIDGLNPTPSFVLLVGDIDEIPSKGSPASDVYYASTDSDVHAEIMLGRFSVSSSTDLANMINKTIFMEMNLGKLDKKAIFIGGQDNGNGHIAEETHDYVIDTYLTNDGYESLKLYTNSDNTATEDKHTTAVNEGAIFDIYSGHGFEKSWSTGDWSVDESDVNGYTNEVFPFTAAFACLTGAYNDESCIAESWIRAEKGAVCNIGSSTTSYWGEDDDMERGMFNAFYDTSDPVLSYAGGMNAGKLNQTGDSYHKQYNFFGDPGLEVFPVDIAPYVEVTSPNGGEKWEQGRIFSVTWDDNFDDNVKIELLKGGSVEEELNASIPSDGLYEWEIPDDFPLGTEYKIRVTCVTQDTLVDESDGTFAMEVKSNLDLKTPDGGEYIEKESDFEITWEDNLNGNVNIDLFRAGVFYINIASSIPSNGSYTWKVSETIPSGSEYRIRVVSNDKDWLNDECSTDISIQNPMIKDYPYIQDFDGFQVESENFRDYWEQLDDDDLEWTVWRGKTPSKEDGQGAATGADNDHTSGSGNYIYVEASTPNNPDKKAHFITPVFDLSTLSEGTCTFWYHMFSDDEGSDDMGDLYVDMSINGKWEEGVVHHNGDQGDEWHSETIDLKDYSGKKLQFRIRAVTGSSWASDICIDDFEIKGTPNSLPEFSSKPDTAAEAEKEYAYTIKAEDSDGNDLTITGKTMPDWLTLTDNGDGTAELKGTPKKDEVGEYEVVITVSDGVIADPIEQSYTLNVFIITAIGIEQEDVNLQRFKIAPNPVDQNTESMRFEFLGQDVREGRLNVYDAVGNTVYNDELVNGIAVWDLQSIRRVSDGVYLAVLWITYNDDTIEQLKKFIGVK